MNLATRGGFKKKLRYQVGRNIDYLKKFTKFDSAGTYMATNKNKGIDQYG